MRVSMKVKALAMQNGLSVDMVKKLLNHAIYQACPICLTRGTVDRPLVLDHKKKDYGCGEFRGLVCKDCSKMIDFFEYLAKRRPESSLQALMGELQKRIG